MTASSLCQRAPRLLAVLMLLLTCFVVSGCLATKVTMGGPILQDIIGEHLDQFPAVVLDATGNTTIDYVFDWDKTTMAGECITTFFPSAKFWRLNAFSVSDGTPVTNNNWQSIAARTVSLNGLKAEKLLRAQLDLDDDPNDVKDRKTYNFIVLFHNE